MKKDAKDNSTNSRRKRCKPSLPALLLYAALAIAALYFLVAFMIYAMLYAGRPGETPFAEIFGISAVVFPITLIIALIGAFKSN